MYVTVYPPPCLVHQWSVPRVCCGFGEESLKVRSKPPPPGQIRCNFRKTCVSCVPLFSTFFRFIFWSRFLSLPGASRPHLGAILPPFSAPKSDLFFDWFFNRFLMIVWWILAVFLATCLVIFTSFVKLTPILKTLISHGVYCKNQGWGPWQRFQNRYKTTSKIGQKLQPTNHTKIHQKSTKTWAKKHLKIH